MDHTKTSSVRHFDADNPFHLCAQVWCVKAGIHHMIFTQIFCPELQSGRVGNSCQSQSADFWRSELIDFTDSNFLASNYEYIQPEDIKHVSCSEMILEHILFSVVMCFLAIRHEFFGFGTM